MGVNKRVLHGSIDEEETLRLSTVLLTVGHQLHLCRPAVIPHVPSHHYRKWTKQLEQQVKCWSQGILSATV
eukprot:356534-Chlamydomonas_euryale.AAC.15